MTLLLSHDPDGRQYVLDRLDRDHIATLAKNARVVLDAWHTVELAYMPGDATWYSILITPVFSVVGAPGGGHTDDPNEKLNPSYVGGQQAYIVVYAQREEAHWCCPEDDMEWLASKFDVSEASQLAIAELLKAVFDSQAAEKDEKDVGEEEDAKFLRKFGPDTGN